MKIRNLFSGVVTNERADIARALIRQGMAEASEPDPTMPSKPGEFTPPAPQWAVLLHDGHEARSLSYSLALTFYGVGA